MKNKEKFIKVISVVLIIALFSAPMFGVAVGARIEIRNELNRWNAEYLYAYYELYEDYTEWKAGINFQEEEVSEAYIEFIDEYFPMFVREVEAKLVVATKYSWLIGKEYKERYTGILYWCRFAEYYFWG